MEVSSTNWSFGALYRIDDFFVKYGDPRVQDWFLMAGPFPLLAIIAIYFYFCTISGPRMMKDRKPFELKELMIVYNFINVGACIWLINELVNSGWLTNYSYSCEPVDYSNSPQGLRMARAAWWYFMFKVIELLDTVFFVLRKKDNQITFLHLYHHTSVPLLTWTAAKFWSGGHGSMAGLLNTLVHVVMYSYYLLTALGPKWRKYLWWKQYVTVIQLVQFLLVVIHQGQIFFNGCDVAKLLPLINVLNSSYFLYLFGSFYVQAYLKNTTKKAGQKIS